MNEQTDLERLVADQLGNAGMGMPPESAIEDTIARAGGTRRLPEWLALIKEPPMRTNNHLAVGSPTVRVAAIMVATLLLAVMLAAAGAGAQLLLAADGPIVVAQDGSGTYETITEAVAAAEDGDKVVVRPGTYVEALIIDKDITITGDGPVEEIVITAPDDGPSYETGFSWNRNEEYALALSGSDAGLADLTFRGENARLIVDGGAPALERLTFEDVGNPYEGGPSVQALVIKGESTATVRNSSFIAGGGINIFEQSSPLIERNEFDTGPGIYGDFGDDTVIVDNHLFGPGQQGIDMGSPAAATIRGNTVSDKTDGMWISGAAVVEDNVVQDSGSNGIAVASAASTLGGPTISGNRLVDNRVAIAWPAGGGLIEQNAVSGGRAGIFIGGGSPIVRDNTVEGVEGRGIVVMRGASPILAGNTACGNGENLVVSDDATPEDDGTNEICEDAPAE